MESKRYKIHLLQGCLFMWIGISVAAAAGETSNAPSQTTAMMQAGQSDQTALAQQLDSTAAMPMDSTAAMPMDSTAAMLMEASAAISLDTTAAMPMEASAAISLGASAAITLVSNCHTFQCVGAHCYRNESMFANASNTTCSSYCGMYRHNNSFYEVMCDEHCMHHLCNETMKDECTLHCCNTSGCMDLNNINSSDSTTAMSTASSHAPTTTATTTTTIAYSDKKCRSFICSGVDCYKTQTGATVKNCHVGINHCELQKVIGTNTVTYEGGCSNTCSTSTKSCAVLTNANCFQECCNATSAGCCMKLDGQVHFNTAAAVRRGSVLKIFTCAIIVIFLSRYISSSHA